MAQFTRTVEAESMNVVVRPVTGADRDLVVALVAGEWGTTVMAVHRELYDAADLPGFIAVADGDPAGILTYRPDADAWEIASLNSVRPGLGAGTALLDTVAAAAGQPRPPRG
jgi:hypothetical protein